MLRSVVSAVLQGHAIHRHRSRVGWQIAHRYTDYFKRARREAPVATETPPHLQRAVSDLKSLGVSSFQTAGTASVAARVLSRLNEMEAAGLPIWTTDEANGYDTFTGNVWQDFAEFEELFAGDVGEFLHAYFGTGFKIFRTLLYRTHHVENRGGSQLWHSDSGPGICLNLMYYLHDVTPEHGALEALPWNDSVRIYRKELAQGAMGKLDRTSEKKRDNITSFYADEIKRAYSDKIVQPVGEAGLVVPFLNNTIHRGGYPAKGRTRTALVWHVYPSHQQTNLGKYRQGGIVKQGPYPRDPAMEF